MTTTHRADPKMRLLPLLALLPLLGTACVMPGKKPVLGSGVSKLADCKAEGLIDDAEDNNNQAAVVEGRGGYWYTYADEAGSSITPAPGPTAPPFTMAPDGANGSKLAANMKGKLAGGAVVFAAMGVNVTDPRDAYDASAYRGVAFWAKRGPGSAEKVRFKIPDARTDGEMGDCTACNNDFGIDLTLTESWARYVIPFAKLTQMPGWGAPRPPRIDASKIYALHWQVFSPGREFDVSVDDVAFVGCE